MQTWVPLVPLPSLCPTPIPNSPGDREEAGKQREQFEGILGQVGGKHSQVEEVEDEELDRLGHILPVDLHLPPWLPKRSQRRKTQQAQPVHQDPWVGGGRVENRTRSEQNHRQEARAGFVVESSRAWALHSGSWEGTGTQDGRVFEALRVQVE